MELKYSERKQSFKEPIIQFGSLFGVAPFYDFGGKKLTHTTLCRMYGLLLSTSMAALSSISCYFFTEMIYEFALLTTLHILLMTTTTVLFVVTVLGASFWNMVNWEQMLQLLSCRQYRIRYVGYFLNVPFLVLVVGALHIAILLASMVYVMDLNFFQPLFQILVLQFTRAITTCSMYNIINSLRKRYEAIGDGLDEINLSTVIKRTTVTRIQNLQTIYMEADKLVDLFNKIFGWPLLLSLLNSVTATLLFLAIFTDHQLKLPKDTSVPNEAVILNACNTVWMVLGSSMVIVNSDKAVWEAKKLLKKCYILRETMPLLPREEEELEKLLNLIENKLPRFTAAHFIEIKRSTILSLISTTTTYMIVILQFNYL